MNEVTRIINAMESGDNGAADRLLPLVYEELRRLAAGRLSREKPGQTLQPTALVHEAYLRLVDSNARNWSNRGHFFSAAAEAMRRILIEKARRKKALKYGGDRKRVEINDADAAIDIPSDDLLALNEALKRLAEEEPDIANVVKLRYFVGLTIEQVAELKGVSGSTVAREWAYGRTWLLHEIKKGDD